MYILGATREQLLASMPKQSVVAEIGVAEGDFSQQIMNRALPKKLHLIDPWLHQTRDDYANDPNNVGQTEADQRHASVQDRFRNLIDANFVQIHRAFSSDAVAEFPDGHFDWIYIDALHTFEACWEDLNLYDSKVKADGFICGHDYAKHPTIEHMQFGVVEAVNKFVADKGYEFMLLTHEAFPTYVIAKKPSSDNYMSVLATAATAHGIVMEIDQPENKVFQQVIARYGDGRERLHYRFG